MKIKHIFETAITNIFYEFFQLTKKLTLIIRISRDSMFIIRRESYLRSKHRGTKPHLFAAYSFITKAESLLIIMYYLIIYLI